VYSAVLKKCLEEALRDHFVCGLRNKQTQKRLLAEKALTWKTAIEIVLAMEVADKQANNFRNPPEDTSVRHHHICKRQPSKESHAFVVAETTSRKNVHSNMKIVGAATQKGTLPKFIKRKHPLHVRSRIGGNSQFGTWNLTTRLQTIMMTNSNCFK